MVIGGSRASPVAVRELFCRPRVGTPRFTNHSSPITGVYVCGADPDNADANEPAPRADGHANAVRRADRWTYEHADDARHASADGRGPTIRADANGRGVR
jgi:hypothetical protein